MTTTTQTALRTNYTEIRRYIFWSTGSVVKYTVNK